MLDLDSQENLSLIENLGLIVRELLLFVFKGKSPRVIGKL